MDVVFILYKIVVSLGSLIIEFSLLDFKEVLRVDMDIEVICY